MKPVYLKIKGFKSFIEEVEIDFNELMVSNLFGISGATRSGKTSILDAIVLSLYGNTKRTSSVYNYINLKSESAALEFTFEIETPAGRKTFTVCRTFRAKNKLHNAELYEETAAGRIAVESTSRNVTKYISELLGLDMEDFTQVVIMQQGEFDKFIKATHSERAQIVGRIFRLDKYGDRLWEKITARREKTGRELARLKGIIEGAQAVPAKELDDLKKTLSAKEKEYKEIAKKYIEAKAAAEQLKTNYDDYEKRKRHEAEIELTQKLISEKALIQDKLAKEYAVYAQAFAEEKKQLEKSSAELNKRMVHLKQAEDYVNARAQLEEERGKLRAGYQQTAESLKDLGEKIQSTDTALKEAAAENAGILDKLPGQDFSEAPDKAAAFGAFVFSARENDKKAKELDGEISALSSEIGKEKESLIAKEKAHTEMLALKIRLENEVKALAAAKEEMELECGELANAVNTVFAHVHTGSECPVCGGEIKEIRAKEIPLGRGQEYLKAAEQLTEAKTRLDGYAALIPSRAVEIGANSDAIKKSEKRFADLRQKRGEIKLIDLGVWEEKFSRFNQNTVRINAYEKELGRLRADTAVAEKSLAQITEKGADLKLRIDEYTAKIREIAGGADIAAEYAKTLDALQNIEKRTLDAEKLAEDKRQAADSEALALNALTEKLSLHKNELAGIKTNTAVSADELRAAEIFRDGLELREKELSKELLIAGEKLRFETENYNKSESARKELKEIQSAADLLEALSELVKGKKLINFMAEEYIANFTKSASKRLYDLTLGQYTLQYNGEFEVVDNYNGGKPRGVDTLSGGETFLVSLALAVAISAEIADTRQFEFFFIDEGFGTLDADLVEMVLESLEKLKHKRFNIGLISHRQELMQRIVVKLRVSGATNDHGSSVEISY